MQVLRHPLDAGELRVGTVLLHPDAQVLLKLPGHVGAEQRAGRLLPAVDRVLVMRPPLAVLAGAREIEDRAVDVELRVVLPAGAVDEGGAQQVGLHRPGHPLLSHTGVAAMLQHRVFEGRPCRGHRHRLDALAHRGFGDGPERGHALVHREGHVDAGGALRVARPLHQLAGPVRREARVEAVEMARIDLAAVLQAEQAPGVEPRPVRLLSGRVVFVGVPERALALQVVLGRRHLADAGYHGGRFPNGRAGAFMIVGKWLARPAAGSHSRPTGRLRIAPASVSLHRCAKSPSLPHVLQGHMMAA